MTAPTTTKVKTMATKEIDVSTMSYAQLQTLISQASAVVESKRKEELKEICQLFVESLETKGFTKAEGVEALGHRKASAAQPKSTSDFPKALWGKSFKHPTTGKVWQKSPTGKGRAPNWLVELVVDGKKYEDFTA